MTKPAGEDKQALQRVGRYEIFDRIASGGMATVHLARLSGAEGFSRVVAVKRMHPHFLVDPALKAMFVAEARIAARVRHPNVVPILDVLAENDEILIIMDYVHGESLTALTRAARKPQGGMPFEIATSVMVGVLQGLHAAHTALDEKGRPLGLVHRDVSPQNVLVGSDGVARVLDFGIAKVLQGHGDTDPGVLKGKSSYMAPELIQGAPPSRQSDLFSAAVVFWELLTGNKLFQGVNEQERLLRVLQGDYPSPRMVAPRVPELLDRIVMRGLRFEPELRHESALEMAIELEHAVPLASQRVVGEWVSGLAGELLAERSELIHQVEASTISLVRRSVAPPGPPSLGVSAAPPAHEPPPPVTSEVRATRPKTRRFGFVVTGIVIAGAALLGALLALRAPANRVVPDAPASETARRGAGETTARNAAPSTVLPLVALPTSSSVAPEAASNDASPASAVAGGSSRHAPGTRPGSSSPARPAVHAGTKRPSTYLPNEL
jgi:serine/threonine-protein kinase